MPLLTIPNVSEGRDASTVARLTTTLRDAACRVLDVHVDAVHNRSVLTATGAPHELAAALGELAHAAAAAIDLRRHMGAHPRVGVLDVCPIVPHDASMERAVDAAHRAATAIAERAGIPIYFYGHAAPDNRALPDIRAGGLARLIERSRHGFAPDLGPRQIDDRLGVVCVGARSVLIAFNVWIAGDEETARAVAAKVRERDGGLPGVRALGLEMEGGLAQVSMNLTDPDRTGVDAAFAAVAAEVRRVGAAVHKTELVGLVPERYLPAPDAEAARLLIEPGRSLESVLTS